MGGQSGREVLAELGLLSLNVDLSTLAPGMYIFNTNSFGKSDTFRVVVQQCAENTLPS